MPNTIHLPATRIYLRATAPDTGEIGIYTSAISADRLETGIDLTEMAVN